LQNCGFGHRDAGKAGFSCKSFLATDIGLSKPGGPLCSHQKHSFMQQTIEQNRTGIAGVDNSTTPVITASMMLDHWQSQRRLTRKLIEAFPADAITTFSIGGMRPFSELIAELIAHPYFGMTGILTDQWPANLQDQGHHGLPGSKMNKEGLLELWDEVTDRINKLWPQIAPARFHEVHKAFGLYEGEVHSTIQYFIDNEIHHRGQAYVYLRALGVEPPAFWDTL
jgi:uncharacterized damage-inducible protein DinB